MKEVKSEIVLLCIFPHVILLLSKNWVVFLACVNII